MGPPPAPAAPCSMPPKTCNRAISSLSGLAAMSGSCSDGMARRMAHRPIPLRSAVNRGPSSTPAITTADGINLEGASFIVIEGFAITNGGTITRAGIRSVTNRGVVIRNNQVDNAGHWGILTGFSDDLLIENNATSRSQIEHGIYVSNACVNPIMRNNQVWGALETAST
jgi:hypothetical protein